MSTIAQIHLEVSQLYVALFGRAPESGGLEFWAARRESGDSVAQLADAMFNTAPAREYFPSHLTNAEIIASFYVNVLGRQADAGGLAFWTAKLNAAGATPGSVIAEMIGVVAAYAGTDPAGLTSAALFNNRSAAAQFYAEHDGSTEQATAVLAGVTSNAETVEDARTLVVAAGAGGTIDAGGFTGISVGALSADLSLVHAGQGAELLIRESPTDLISSSMFDHTPRWSLNYFLADASGTGDVLSVMMESADSINVQLKIPGVEHLVIETSDKNSAEHANLIFLTDEVLSSLTVSGSVFTGFEGTTVVESFDAGALQAGTSIEAWWPPYLDDEPTLQGSPGDDFLWSMSGSLTINGAAGDDFIRLRSFDVASGGSGADIFEISENRNLNDWTAFSTIADFAKSTDLAAGDVIDLWQVIKFPEAMWIPSKLATSGSLAARLDTAAGANVMATSGHSIVRWFQYSGDTYVVVDNSDAWTFQAGVDQAVKLVGLIDLSTLNILDWQKLG